MPNRRSSRRSPTLERVEPRLAPSGVSGPPQELLNALQQSGYADVFDIMQMFHQVAQSQRAAARESREVAREAQYAAIETQAAKMREAANLALAAGIVSGSMSIAGGAVSLNASRAGISAVRDAGQLQKGLAVAEINKLAPKLGEIGKLEHSTLLALRDASLQGQKAMEAEAHDRLAHRTELHDQDLIQQMMETMQQVRDKMSQIANAQTESLRTIMRA